MWFRRSTPRVTVVLAAYNHAEFVRAAVMSVLDQTLHDLELIVVDDGSSDGTPDVVAAIRDPRLSLIRMPLNRAVHPRNLAIGRARGRFIAFQNSDDVWSPAKLAAQVAAMEARPELALCCTATRIIGADGAPDGDNWANGLFTTENRAGLAWLRHFFDIGNCLAISSAMVRRRQLLRLGGFRASLVQLSDFDLWVRLAAIGEIAILPDALCDIRIVEGRNLSGPSPAAGRRTQIELASVLENFAVPPLLDRLPEIFPELRDMTTRGARKVALARRWWPRDGGYALFADRVIAQVMENQAERAEAVAALGPDFIHDFIARRGQAAFHLQNGAPQ